MRLCVPLKRLVERNFGTILADEMNVHWRIRVEEVDARLGSDAGGLADSMGRDVYEVSGLDLDRLIALNLKRERATHHHDVLVRRMPMPRNSAAGREFLHRDGRRL